MPTRLHTFVRDETLPSYWANRIQDALSGLFRFQLSRLNATTVQVIAGAGDAAAVVNVQGLWRFVEATISRAHPGGGPGTYLIFATAKAQNVVNVPDTFTDNTDYAWSLAIVPNATTPAIVPGTVDVFRRIGRLTWDGAQITGLVQEVGGVSGAQIDPAAIVGGGVQVTRQADGSVLLDIANGAVATAKVADAAITKAKLAADALSAFLKLAVAADRKVAFGVAATGSFGGGKRLAGAIAHGMGLVPIAAWATAGWLQTFGDSGSVPVIASTGVLTGANVNFQFETANGDNTSQSCPFYWLAIG